MSSNNKCKHYREEGVGADLGWNGGCTCNNDDPHDIGDCVYEDGIVKGEPICKYYEPRIPIAAEMLRRMFNRADG